MEQVIRKPCTYLNLQETYVDDSEPYMVILVAETFMVKYMYHIIKYKSSFQLVFGHDMILPIKHIADCKFIFHNNQAKIDKEVIHKNSNRINCDYIVGDQVWLRNKSAYKYKTSLNVRTKKINMEKWNSNIANGRGYN